MDKVTVVSRFRGANRKVKGFISKMVLFIFADLRHGFVNLISDLNKLNLNKLNLVITWHASFE